MTTENSKAREEIILIGPMAVGKSTVALYLSERLGLLSYPVDRLKWYYRFKNGYDLAKGTRLLRDSGFHKLATYFGHYFGNAELAQILHEFRGGIFDFGASHCHFERPQDLREAKRILKPFSNIVQLLPTDSFVENCKILDRRITKRYQSVAWKKNVLDSYLQQNRIYLKSHSYDSLSKFTIYTKGKSIEEVGDQIVRKINRSLGNPWQRNKRLLSNPIGGLRHLQAASTDELG